MQNSAGQWPACCRRAEWLGGLQVVTWFYSSAVEVNLTSALVCLARSDCAWRPHSLPPPPPLPLCGKY